MQVHRPGDMEMKYRILRSFFLTDSPSFSQDVSDFSSQRASVASVVKRCIPRYPRPSTPMLCRRSSSKWTPNCCLGLQHFPPRAYHRQLVYVYSSDGLNKPPCVVVSSARLRQSLYRLREASSGVSAEDCVAFLLVRASIVLPESRRCFHAEIYHASSVLSSPYPLDRYGHT